MKNLILTLFVLVTFFDGVAQEKKSLTFFDKHPVVNRFEIGALMGRVKVPQGYNYYGWTGPCYGCTPTGEQAYKVQDVRDISLRLYTGIQLHPKTTVGVTIGADDYEGSFITPIMIGARQTLIQKKTTGNEVFAGLDIGHGNTWFHEDDANFVTKGGIAFNPTIGYKLSIKNKSSFILSLGYSYQEAQVEYVNEFNNDYIRNETRKHQRVTARVGFEF